ncbi:hypothetical protein C2845_PM05G24070 [Panicum miliaceum]|uniref:Uncharacterized protein n=1 Tax=Panicum miliaceum TaxID=4540 RepID=A0A3L6T2K8_PANMI|nr:hypothetical protein C2845_PM05G24070 [Panicum miliaceum]
MEEFPHLAEYGNFLHGGGGGDQGLSGRESGLPPIRAQRTLGVRTQCVAGGGGVAAAGRARQLNFGAVSHDGGVFLGGPSSGAGAYRGGSSSMGGGGRRQRAMVASRGGGRRRGSGRGGRRGAHAPLPPQVTLQAPGGSFVNLDGDDEGEDDNKDYGSSGEPPKHTGLGRKPDGTIDAESEFWKTYKSVDGTTCFVPGQDFFEEDDPEGDDKDEENLVATPTSTSYYKSKKSLGSTTSTADGPIKKSKSPMVRYMKQIANTFSEAVQVNQQVMKKCVSKKFDARREKDSFSVKRCQEQAFECGIQPDSSEVYAMGKMFQDAF